MSPVSLIRRSMIAACLGVMVFCLSALAASAQQIPLAGTTAPKTGDYTPSGENDVTKSEFPGQLESESGPGAYPGSIVNRSLSTGTGHGASVNSGKKAKSNPQFKTGFEGLNFFQQRYARGGNQFSVEPPDQALCAGNGYVLEAVNDVLNIFNASGQSVLPDNTATNIVSGFPTNVNHAVDLNSFFGYAPAINRATGVRGPFVTDPSCLYDAATQRWFVVVLTLDTLPNGAFTTVNHLDIAVSKTPNPTGLWNIYRVDVTNDGSPGNTGGPCPCLGDYPHIGADANGFYITTNAYPWGPGDFDGAQIYAFSKAQLAAGAANVTMAHIDTTDKVNATSPIAQMQPGFTVWPAQSPGTSSFALDAGGTEYFLSSNAGEEAAGDAYTGSSTNLVVWALTNTSSLNSASPALSLTNKVLSVGLYGVPPKQRQPGSGTLATINAPQGFCINDTITSTIAGTGCWKLLFGSEPAHNELISRPDSNDTRMQQVMYANGKLWGSLDTALNPDAGAQRAGIAWYIVKPDVSTGSLTAKVASQGYLGAAGYDFTYPAIGVTPSGRGVIAFTATGDTTNPSAAYASIDALIGVGPWNIVPGGLGAAQDDGFTSYKSQVGDPPRTRWGDYGAAAVDGNSIWIASEYIANTCQYTAWGGRFFGATTGDNKLGTCAASPGAAGPRAALGNWSTRISKLTP
ncbi:MAG TPA: hypothetical protein VN622_05320 [Clostridia bacterium]|nr:hypothetical protein [Clostridia bacterium]